MPRQTRLQPGEIEFEAFRASRPGGQNVNKVATAGRLRFDGRRARGAPRRRTAGRRSRRRPPSGDVWRRNASGVRPKAGGVESTTMDEEGRMDLSVGGAGPRLAQRGGAPR